MRPASDQPHQLKLALPLSTASSSSARMLWSQLLSFAAVLLPALAAARPAEGAQILLASTPSSALDGLHDSARIPRDEPETGTGHLSQWSKQNKVRPDLAHSPLCFSPRLPVSSSSPPSSLR